MFSIFSRQYTDYPLWVKVLTYCVQLINTLGTPVGPVG